MKLSVILAASVTAEKFHKKEWEVQDAYFAGEDVVLSDPTIRHEFKDFYQILPRYQAEISSFSAESRGI